MSLVGFKARNHPQQRRNAAVDDRGTPPEVFAPLLERFNFTLDVAASPHNACCKRYFTYIDDGLAQGWAGHSVWCNPPYSDIRPWVEKAWVEWRACRGIVLLLPANRTEQAWWQDLVEPYRDRSLSPLRVEFWRGRTRFVRVGSKSVGANERPPFGCCLLIWAPRPFVQGDYTLTPTQGDLKIGQQQRIALPEHDQGAASKSDKGAA